MADYRIIRAQEERSWLASLPEEIYTKDNQSHIVRLLDALCGDSGVGRARKILMLRRLQTSLSATRYSDLDTVYSTMFGLRRLPEESYEYLEGGLFTDAQQYEVNIKDAKYRQRIRKYMEAVKYGGTKEGIRLAAESATGCACLVIDGHEYYKSRQMADGSSSNTFYPTVDYAKFFVVVDKPLGEGETDLPEEMVRNVYNVLKRLQPSDTTFDVMSLAQLKQELGIEDDRISEAEIASIEASSEYWRVRKYVTGRPDWDYYKYPSLWIEPNVRKEAPRQLLVNCQEDSNDFTSMVSDVVASSEHIGSYNKMSEQLFGYLDYTELSKGSYAISASSIRFSTSSFYGGESVIDWSYPYDYINELQASNLELARSYRYWSSVEKGAGESDSLEISFRRRLPFNHVKLAVSRKPVKVRLYASNAEVGDEPEWVEVVNEAGVPISYIHRTWGQETFADDFAPVEFTFPVMYATAFKIEVERLDTPYMMQLSPGAYEKVEFPYSIELQNVSFFYDVFSSDAYVDAVYEDAFGNKVETEKVVYDSGSVNSDDGYWVCQPNLAADTVEYLTVTFSDTVTVNHIDIEAVYDGCQMNLYSVEDADSEDWKPYPGVYVLESGGIDIPSRTVAKMKLEFTNLGAVPYKMISNNIPVESRMFPRKVRDYINAQDITSRQSAYDARFLYSPQEDVQNVYNEIGINDIYQQMQQDKVLWNDNMAVYGVHLFSGADYRSRMESSIGSVYGEDMRIENSLAQTLPSGYSVAGLEHKYKFVDEGPHEYETRIDFRVAEMAYVVGIKSMSFSNVTKVFATDGSPFVFSFARQECLAKNNGWALQNDERFHPVTEDYMCVLETEDIQTTTPFRSFDFAVNESEPRSIFDHPSDMSQEWSSYNDAIIERTEFGLSGTVLSVKPGNSDWGVESEPKMVRANSICSASVEVFPDEDSAWVFECKDDYGDELFSMEYSLTARRWNTLGAVFLTQPSASWWNSLYEYRVKIPVVGAIAQGEQVFIPCFDFKYMYDERYLQEDWKNAVLVWWNGIQNTPIDYDLTDNMELWFRCQQPLGAGQSASGSMDFDTNEYRGAYYLYFGTEATVDDALTDYTKVFDGKQYETVGDIIEIDDYRLSDNDGFVSFDVKPDSGWNEVDHTRHYLFEYEDEAKRVVCYVYNKQLIFTITDFYEDFKFNSSFASVVGGNTTWSDSTIHRLLIQWGKKGSAVRTLYPGGDTDRKYRRFINVYHAPNTASPSYSELTCIDNIYNTRIYDIDHEYDGGTY